MISKTDSTLEDLSDEILMEIFDAMELPSDIYFAFYNLNQRFNRILSDPRLLMSLDFNAMTNAPDFVYHCETMLPNMTKQLISLRLSNEQSLYEQIEVFLRFQHLHRFHALRRLCLIQVTFVQLTRMIFDILSLNKLLRLDIDMFDGSGITVDGLNDVANRLLNESNSIQSLYLRFNRELVISQPACSTLTDLTIDACFSTDVPNLLQFCSNLRSLRLKVEPSARRSPLMNITNIDVQQHPLVLIPNTCLTDFSLDINDLNFTDIYLYLFLMPNLLRFRLEGLSYDVNLSKGDLWHKLLEKHNKNLRQFDLAGVRIWLGNNADDQEDENNLNMIHQINQSFGKHHPYWGRQWIVHQSHKLRPNHLNLTLNAKTV